MGAVRFQQDALAVCCGFVLNVRVGDEYKQESRICWRSWITSLSRGAYHSVVAGVEVEGHS